MTTIIISIIAIVCSALFTNLAVRSFNKDCDLGKVILFGILALMAFVGFIWAIANPGVGTCMFNIFAGTEYLLGITDMFVFVLYCVAHSC